jgi:hypothetical protein
MTSGRKGLTKSPLHQACFSLCSSSSLTSDKGRSGPFRTSFAAAAMSRSRRVSSCSSRYADDSSGRSESQDKVCCLVLMRGRLSSPVGAARGNASKSWRGFTAFEGEEVAQMVLPCVRLCLPLEPQSLEFEHDCYTFATCRGFAS